MPDVQLAVFDWVAFPEHSVKIRERAGGSLFDTPQPRVLGALSFKSRLELVDDRFETFDDGDRI